MRRKHLCEHLSLILLGFWLFSGCDAISSTPVVSTVNLTPSPTLTLTPTFTPLPTSTSNPTFTPTPGPTLSTEQIQANILAALETNGGCRFPCWLGVTPGQTPQDDALALLGQINFAGVFYSEKPLYWGGLIFSPASEGNSVFYDLLLQDKIVSYIRVHVQGYSNHSLLHREWESILPESIIADYGTPTRVWIEANFSTCEGSGPCNTSLYNVWLFYDEQGFLIEYMGNVPYQSTYTFCPTFSKTGNLGGSIEIYTRSLEDTKPLEDISGLPSVTLEDTKSLESITGMSLDEFAAHYKQNDQSFCFSTPRDIWP
jgi:hypothetical protein